MKWDKTELATLYQDEQKTLREIAAYYGVTYEAIRLNLKKLNIPRRSTGYIKEKSYPHRWESLNQYFRERETPTNPHTDILKNIPKYLLPHELRCSDCGKISPHMHFHHIVYPARDVNDFLVLCASCHKARHMKGMTWDKQIDLYRQHLSGTSNITLASQYNISRQLVDKIIKKIRNNHFTTHGH